MNFLSKLLQVLAFIPGIISSVEGLFRHRSGTDKKNAVLDFLQSALSMGDAAMSQEIVDQDKFKSGLSAIIDGIVQCLNASVWGKAQ